MQGAVQNERDDNDPEMAAWKKQFREQHEPEDRRRMSEMPPFEEVFNAVHERVVEIHDNGVKQPRVNLHADRVQIIQSRNGKVIEFNNQDEIAFQRVKDGLTKIAGGEVSTISQKEELLNEMEYEDDE